MLDSKNSVVKKSLSAFFILSGTVIGASFLALPYVALKSGIFLTTGYLLILTVIVTLIHYFYAEVVVKTDDFMRLPSYAKIYLGRIGKSVALLATVVGFCGSLLAYIIVGSKFLSGVFSPLFGGNSFVYASIFFIAGTLIVFFGKKAVSGVDFLDVFLFIFVLAVVLFFGWPLWKYSNLFVSAKESLGETLNVFLPYGVLLSALWGATVIPEMEEILGHRKDLLKKIVPWGIIIPAIFYLLFILLILGIAGSGISPEAISGLKNYLPQPIINFLLLFGLIVVFTSYVCIGLSLRNMLRFDFNVPKKLAWAIACFLPFILYLFGFRNFIEVIGFVGAIALAIEGILIILMYNKIKGKWILTFPIILALILGMIYEIVHYF